MGSVTYQYSPAQQRFPGRAYRLVDSMESPTMETYRALPPADHPYSEYDMTIIAEILTLAEKQALIASRKGRGTGIVTLQRLLKAYEVVLPVHEVRPQEDIYYYRLLLKLSLDPDPDWWSKLEREKLLNVRSRHQSPARDDSDRRRGSHSAASTSPRHLSPARMASLSGAGPRTSPPRMPSPPRYAPGIGMHPSTQQPYIDPRTSPPRAPSPPRYTPGIGMHPSAQQPYLDPRLVPWQTGPMVMVPAYGSPPQPPMVIVPAYASPPQPPMQHSMAGSDPIRPDYASPTRHTRRDYSSDEDNGSEADAYAEFRSMAHAFRTWRSHVFVITQSRDARERAIENWMIALSFWEVQTARRYLRAWRSNRKEALAKAVKFWMGSTVAGCFRWWLQVTQYLKVASKAGILHFFTSVRTRCFHAWRSYAAMRKSKAGKVVQALSFWGGRSLELMFRTWRRETENSIANGTHADVFYESQARGKLLLLWRKVTLQLRNERLAADAISAACNTRLVCSYLSTWQQRCSDLHHRRGGLAKATGRWRSSKLSAAFQTFRQNVEAMKEKRDKLRRAAMKLYNVNLLKSWNAWVNFIAHGKGKRTRLAKSLGYWTNSVLSSAWTQWMDMVLDSQARQVAARELAIRIMSKNRDDAYRWWREWHQERMEKASLLECAAGHVADCARVRVIRAWRIVVRQRRKELVSFDSIMSLEAHRLRSLAFGRMQRVWAQTKKVHYIRNSILVGCAIRCLRHWQVLSKFKRLRRKKRAQALETARWQHKARLFGAFRLITAIAAEHKRIVAAARYANGWRLVAGCLTAFGLHVDKRAAKKLQMLSALLHWERATQARGLRGWLARLIKWRRKAAKVQQAATHCRQRMLDGALRRWLHLWTGSHRRLEKALQFVFMSQGDLCRRVMVAWKQVALVLGAKHSKVRRALAHWIGNQLGIGFYSWLAVCEERGYKRKMLRRSLVFWIRGMIASAFNRWKDHALYKVDVNRRAMAYFALLCGRNIAFSFFMLRANAVRKGRSRDAAAYFHRCIKRKVMYGWRVRIKMEGELEQRLRMVFHSMLGDALRGAFESWVSYISQCHMKRTSLYKALYFWMNSLLRVSFNTLRWNSLRNQMGRALAGQFAGKRKADCFQLWRDFVVVKKVGALRVQKAVGYWVLAERSKAWRRWREHHDLMQRTKRAMRHMLNRALAGAFITWWGVVLEKRQAMGNMEATIVKLKMRGVAKAFNMLQAQVVRRQKKRDAWHHFLCHLGRQLFRAWRLQPKLSMALALWTGNKLRVSFLLWRDYMLYQRHLKQSQHSIAKRWTNLDMSIAFNTWKDAWLDACDTRLRAGQALGYWQNRQLAAAFNTWVDFMEWRARMQQITNEIVRKIQNRQLVEVMNEWRLFMGCRALAHMVKMRIKAECFVTWHGEQVTNGKVNALMARVVRRMVSETVGGAFQSWHAYTVKMKSLRLVLMKVLGRYLDIAFHGWREAAAELKHRKTMQACITEYLADRPFMRDMCLGIMDRWSMWPLAYPFYSWLTKLEDRKSLLEKASMAIFNHSYGMLEKAWHSWRSVLSDRQQQQHKLAHAMMMMGDFMLARTFHWWSTVARYLSHMRAAIGVIMYKRALSSMRSLFGFWRYRVHYQKLSRRVMAHCLNKAKLEVFTQWRDQAKHMVANRAKINRCLKMILNRQLAIAWTTWRSMMSANDTKRVAMERCLMHWSNRSLTDAFNKWMDFWEGRCLGTRAAVHYYGRLLDNAWMAWRDFTYGAELERGGGAMKKLLWKRSFDCWRQFMAMQAVERNAVQGLIYLNMRRTVTFWQGLVRAHQLMRAMYMRRALHGWYNRVLHLQEQRARLLSACQTIIFGCLARCFSTWLEYTRTQFMKRLVFSQKQAAIQEALRIGDQIRNRHNTELVTATFQAWRLQAGIFKRVALRFAAIWQQNLLAMFRAWRDWTVDVRIKGQTAIHHFRVVLLDKVLAAWMETAAEMHERTLENEDLAEDHWFVRCARRAMTGLRKRLELSALRRSALIKVFKRQVAEERRDLLEASMTGMKQLIRRRMEMWEVANSSSKSRKRRIMGEHFNLWLSYTLAMKAVLDPDSPFLSPRSKRDNRNLIRRTAVMIGSTEVDAGSEDSAVLFGDIYATTAGAHRTSTHIGHQLGAVMHISATSRQRISGGGIGYLGAEELESEDSEHAAGSEHTTGMQSSQQEWMESLKARNARVELSEQQLLGSSSTRNFSNPAQRQLQYQQQQAQQYQQQQQQQFRQQQQLFLQQVPATPGDRAYLTAAGGPGTEASRGFDDDSTSSESSGGRFGGFSAAAPYVRDASGSEQGFQVRPSPVPWRGLTPATAASGPSGPGSVNSVRAGGSRRQPASVLDRVPSIQGGAILNRSGGAILNNASNRLLSIQRPPRQ